MTESAGEIAQSNLLTGGLVRERRVYANEFQVTWSARPTGATFKSIRANKFGKYGLPNQVLLRRVRGADLTLDCGNDLEVENTTNRWRKTF
jgi:hypothetical protein